MSLGRMRFSNRSYNSTSILLVSAFLMSRIDSNYWFLQQVSNGEELVGSKVKVWWPIDRKWVTRSNLIKFGFLSNCDVWILQISVWLCRFYKGVVDSFNSRTKKHRVIIIQFNSHHVPCFCRSGLDVDSITSFIKWIVDIDLSLVDFRILNYPI